MAEAGATEEKKEVEGRSLRARAAEDSKTEGRPLRRQLRERLNNGKFMENFNPETSARETRKVTRKLYSQQRFRGNLHDAKGVHIKSGKDICDCFEEDCEGCHLPCPKCYSQKCGHECRINRKWIYEQIEIEGTDVVMRNPVKY